MSVRKRCRFMIDNDVATRLEAIRSRTGLSMAEQIRRALDVWLETDTVTGQPPRSAAAAVPRRRTRASPS